jgi:hypothetical protein
VIALKAIMLYGLGLDGALALALLLSAWPPWAKSWPTPAVV